MRALRITGYALALAALVAPAASAQTNEATRLTYLTFSGPVHVPRATLPAGTYTFRLADPTTGNAHVVQVLSRDGKKVFAQFLTIPNQRAEAPKDTVVMFAERPAGAPQAVKIWYYPGNSSGEEFIYPKREAIEIAKANHTAVLATDDESNNTSAKYARVNEKGEEAEASKEPESVVAEARPQQQTAPAAVATGGQEPAAPKRTKLPQTGSDLSLVALLSALSLAGAFGVRRARRSLANGI